MEANLNEVDPLDVVVECVIDAVKAGRSFDLGWIGPCDRIDSDICEIIHLLDVNSYENKDHFDTLEIVTTNEKDKSFQVIGVSLPAMSIGYQRPDEAAYRYRIIYIQGIDDITTFVKKLKIALSLSKV
jgi:hypothetical protein